MSSGRTTDRIAAVAFSLSAGSLGRTTAAWEGSFDSGCSTTRRGSPPSARCTANLMQPTFQQSETMAALDRATLEDQCPSHALQLSLLVRLVTEVLKPVDGDFPVVVRIERVLRWKPVVDPAGAQVTRDVVLILDRVTGHLRTMRAVNQRRLSMAGCWRCRPPMFRNPGVVAGAEIAENLT